MSSTVTRLVAGLLVVSLLPAVATAQQEDPVQPNWAAFHSTADAYHLLEGWSARFPKLTKLYSIGETLRGTPLMVLEITNTETGPASEKPGYYYDGNIHAEELTGAEVALHFAWHVLTSYGSDPRITRLLDTRALYVRPKFNPDGADVALTTPHNPRSTPRPYDEDRDGLLDEDPGNDLDGDGVITQMRVRDPAGQWKISPIDPRLMERRSDGDLSGPFYALYSEGVDDDGDGALNEDGVGGIDMNRNFPRNWGLEFEQRGAGPYPLSEPETRATIEFLHSHRNVTGIFHGHTSGGFVYRLPSTTAWDDFSLADQRLIIELAGKYNETTGQPVVPSYSNPRVHRHGTLISWGYWDFGVVGFVPEFWGGFGEDYDGDGSIDDAERLRWNDTELGGAGFTPWTAYDHPELGAVEVGGWRARFTRRNPPPHLLEGEIGKYVPWMLWLAEISPLITIEDVRVTPVRNTGLLRVSAVVRNTGYLPTNLTQRAIDAEVVVPVRATVDVRDAELVAGQRRIELGHLRGGRDARDPQGATSARRLLEFTVRRTGTNPRLQLVVRSEKGGTARRTIVLGTETGG